MVGLEFTELYGGFCAAHFVYSVKLLRGLGAGLSAAKWILLGATIATAIYTFPKVPFHLSTLTPLISLNMTSSFTD